MSKKLIYSVCFVFALVLFLTSAANAADPNLVGWWRFDGDALDSSGNERHGTLNGSPTFGPGVFGQALECQANPDYVTIDGYKGILGTHAFSITAWVKTTNTAIGQIVHWGNHSGGQRVEFRINSNRLRISHGDGNVQGNTDLTDGEWYHVAATVIDNATASSGDVTFYVDGQDDTMESTDPDGWDIVANATLDVTIGWRPTQQDRPFIGSIDDVRIYDKVLTQEEVQQIIEGGGGEPYPFALGPTPTDGALLEDTWASLSWRAGEFAVSHDVYIGDNFDDVNDGAGDTFIGNQATTTLIVGFPGFAFPDGLVPGTTYYWRIDEVNDTDPNSPWKGNVWSFSIPPKNAYYPDPADGAKFIDPNVELSWNPGFGAMLHTVYFGENFADVNSAAEGLAQADATYTPGPLELEKTYYWRVDEFDGAATLKGDVLTFSTMPVIDITDPSLIGWWKFDAGVGTIAPDWSGHGNHGLIVSPQWLSPGWIGESALNFGTGSYMAIRNLVLNDANSTDVTVSAWIRTSNIGMQTIASFDRSEYWRFEVDGYADPGEIGWSVNTSTGTVDLASQKRVDDGLWHHVAGVFDNGVMAIYIDGALDASITGGSTFGTGTGRYGFIASQSEATVFNGDRSGSPGYWIGGLDDVRIYDKALTQEEILVAMRADLLLAWGPKPTPGSTLYIRDATPFSWSPGDNASQHDVYFGTDRDAVADANASDTTGIYRGRQGVTSYTPPEGVEWGGGPYYWRIDEYNTDATISEGRIWNFTVTDFIGIDNFEDYNDWEPDRIFETWIDGWEVPTNGSTVGYPDPNFDQGEHFVETNIVHGGGQSMPYFYDNNFKYSEATMTLSYPRNWTEEGVGVLSLWFHGDASNAAERMYVALNGSAVVYHDNPDAALIEEWTEWTIDLQEFADQGVNLANVNTISIGFGDKNNLQPGGSGLVFFDDIRLYRPEEPEPEPQP